MQNESKRNIIGILIDAVDYEAAVEFVVRAAREKRPATISAMAVHGLMSGVLDSEQKYRLNHFDLIVPDGQPIRWALNLLHGAGLPDRVYGPTLTRKVCARAAAETLPVYFYGSTPDILSSLRRTLETEFPRLSLAGMEPSKFRRLKLEEKVELANRIRHSGATITFVGMGCPRQEVFAFEFRELLGMPIICVGGAFSHLPGILPTAPSWMQNAGLEWVFRLFTEPRRLWRRYIYLNPTYMILVVLQALRLLQFPTRGKGPIEEVLYG